jgi:ABC-type Fe3+/spermidine/putrescine transport system ATPase subunit
MVDVHLTGLTKRYGGAYAVDHVDLTIPSGSFVTLLGPSGCGKTTTLRSIAGLEEPDGGSIRIGDRTVVDVAGGVFVQPERRKVGMVFQSYALWPHMTVAQNVAYPLRRRGRSRTEVADQVAGVLELVNLGAMRDRSVAALSGGQQQRVALARAMIGDPVLTLFDEPLSNLDVKLRGRMRSEIRALHDRIGMTSIYVTHDQEEALALSDLVVVMNEGRVHQVGSPQDIYFRPTDAFVADFVGYENQLPVTVTTGAGGRARVRTASGSEFETSTKAAPGQPAIAFARPADLSPAARRGLVAVGSGEVLDSTYLGTAHEYRVATPGGVLLARDRADDGRLPAFSAGETVTLHLDPAHAVILPVDDGRPQTSALEPAE